MPSNTSNPSTVWRGHTAREIFRQIVESLKTAGVESPDLEADWLLEKYASLSLAARLADGDREVPAKTREKLSQGLQRRLLGEPLAYILGERDFYGRTFQVSPAVLIPRPETEGLVEWALDWCRRHECLAPRILDLGTGSGCVGLTLLAELPKAQLTALDISSPALTVAQQNAVGLNVADRAEFIENDAALFAGNGQLYDLVVANPPYIALHDPEVAVDVRQFEPAQALFAESEGLAAITAWARNLHRVIKARSAVGFEIGYRQGPKALELFRDLGLFSLQYVRQDLSGLDRFVCGEREVSPTQKG